MRVQNLLAGAGTLLWAYAVHAHHSDAGIDMDSTVTLDGTITEFHWSNPHVYFMIEAPNEAGELVEWSVQLGSTITTSRIGWNKDYLHPGDAVVVTAHPASNGRPYGILETLNRGEADASARVTTPGSSETLVPLPDGTAQSDSLEGTWLADRSTIRQYVGGFDGFFTAELKLTPAGAAAMAAYDPLSPENPESQCIGRPTPAMIVSSQLYPLHIQFNDDQTITIQSEFWDEVRTVYMDGRQHPTNGERTISGHSIGRWEGDVLIVDTRNFADHRSPYQIGVPSGAQKHVVERYELIDDGRRVRVEFTLEDPEFIAEPLTHSRELLYAPNMTIQPFNCDPEATRRFLEVPGAP